MPMRTDIQPILLDTHPWLWLMNGDADKFGIRALKTIADAAKNGGLLVSIISVWEVSALEANGHIRLDRTCGDWVHAALKAPGTVLLNLDPELIMESNRLPADFRGDPVDRILVATARREGALLATRDPVMLSYGDRKLVKTLAL
jgi:PIN domain nuclease of toxin-antitoxin system